MPEAILIPIYILTFLYGIVVGSFLNVVIYRVPKHESVVKVRSHCMKCGYNLKWYDLIPVFSYIGLKGRCRSCGEKISPQYPVIEAANGLIWLVTVMIKGVNVESLLYCLLYSALLSLSIIDWRTFEIPIGFNYFIGVLGIINLLLNLKDWPLYIIGAVCVSGLLFLIYLATKGRGIGGGDVKLMATTGLLLGWKVIIFSLAAGCLAGAITHVIRMRVSKVDKVLAMGPYLSIGIFLCSLIFRGAVESYFSIFSF